MLFQSSNLFARDLILGQLQEVVQFSEQKWFSVSLIYSAQHRHLFSDIQQAYSTFGVKQKRNCI